MIEAGAAPSGLVGQRLAAQLLDRPAAGLADAFARLLAVQAQDYAAGLQAAALRAGMDVRAVEVALADGGLVRSWPVRGTLHLIRPDDLAWLLPLCRDRARSAARGRHRTLGLDTGDFVRAADVLTDRLDGARATRADLLAALREAGIGTEGQRGAHLILRLSQDGVIVQTTKDLFARYRDVVGEYGLDRSEALGRLALRYVTGHGPVTERDLAWWAGLTLADARAGLASVRDQVELVGGHYRVPGVAAAEQGVWLLPAFDEYVLGYADRSAQLGGEPLDRVVPGLNGMFLSSVVVDGVVAGTWRRTRRGGVVEIDVDWFRPLPPGRRGEFADAVARWGELAGVGAVASAR